MALSRKSSVKKGGQAAASTTPATSRNAGQPRKRSANPSNLLMPAGIRDEPPARSTRSCIKALQIANNIPTAEQRAPIDCPSLRCSASTVHQHLPQLQYYNPHAIRAAHYRGYERSDHEIPNPPSLRGTFRMARQDQNGSLEEPQHPEGDDVAKSQEGFKERKVVLGGDEKATREQLVGESRQNAAQDESSPAKTEEVEQAVAKLDSRAGKIRTRSEGTSNRFTSPVTPPQSSSLSAGEEPSSHHSPMSPDQHDKQHTSASQAPQHQFGDWLPGHGPNATASNPPGQHIHTYEELIRPLVNSTLPPAPGMAEVTRILQEFRSPRDPSYCPDEVEEDPDLLLSMMMREPVTEYMRQYEELTEEEIDWETELWQ